MLPLEVRKYLFDMRSAGELLAGFTAGKTFAEYCADPLLRSGVERQFEIIGEALSQALRIEPGLAARLSDVGRIVAFRNRLIHGYASVSNEVVWGILEANLPVLRREVEALLPEA
jgi:uncharacterized protein with HEPN domain